MNAVHLVYLYYTQIIIFIINYCFCDENELIFGVFFFVNIFYSKVEIYI
jgi:hypothetical protein